MARRSKYGVALPEVMHARVAGPAEGGRLIVVGDVHGCCDEFEELLERLAPAAEDVVVMAGDLINKGPRSVDVVRLCRERGIPSVRGNHDDYVLGQVARRAQVRAQGGDPSVDLSPKFDYTDGFSDEDLQYLRELPYTISVESHALLVVHAGLVPGLPLQEQDADTMMHMRDLTPDNEPRDKKGDGEPWATRWPGPELVVFGHDAQRGLQQLDRAVGLDTGCVYGGSLTALVLLPGGEREIVAVQAHQMWQVPKGAVPPEAVLAPTTAQLQAALAGDPQPRVMQVSLADPTEEDVALLAAALRGAVWPSLLRLSVSSPSADPAVDLSDLRAALAEREAPLESVELLP